MKFAVTVFILLASLATQAADKVTCFVDIPCAWLDPAPGSNQSLGYCVGAIEGDISDITVKLVDATGEHLKDVALAVRQFDRTTLLAYSDDEKFELGVGAYGDIFAGGLLVKTTEAPDGLGFMTSCRISK